MGGTNSLSLQLTGLTDHNLLIGAGTATITKVAPSATSGIPVISQGAASDPAFGTAVVAGGGTGSTSFNINGVAISNTTTTGALASLTLTDGQIVIGSTGNSPAAATLTEGNGISITNAANSITIATSGAGFDWEDDSGAIAVVANSGYFITATSTATLPASPSQGDAVAFIVDTTDVLTIQAVGTQVIRISGPVSAAAGTAVSTSQGSAVTLIYRSANTSWIAAGGVSGTWQIT